METLKGYDTWKTTPPPLVEVDELRYTSPRTGREVCTCEAYSFPHAPDQGECETCRDCGQPYHGGCICPCWGCGYTGLCNCP